MRNNNSKILIIALTTILIFGGFSPILFATAGDHSGDDKIECPKLHIQLVWPSENLEGEMSFIVEVVDEYGEGIYEATVYVETESGSDSFPTRETDADGVAAWEDVTKWVDETTVYQVWATHDDYCFDGEYGYYTVTNRALHFVVLPPNKKMNEQTFGSVYVEDQYNNPIACWVYFQSIPYWTGSDGWVSIYAFDVTAENVLEDPWVPVSIYACKDNYDSAYDVIRVKDLDNVEVTLDCDVDYAQGGNPVEDADVCIIVGGEGCNVTNQYGKCQFYVFPDTLLWTRYVLMACYPGYWPCLDSLRVFAIPESSWDFDFNLEEIPWWIEYVTEVEMLDFTENTGLGTFTVELEATPSIGTPDLYTYNWDFGDGDFSMDEEHIVSHDYDEEGRYIITVTAISPSAQTGYGEIHLGIR